MKNFDIKSTITPIKLPELQKNYYEESVRLSEVTVKCPFTKCQVEQLEMMWKESYNVNLSQLTPYPRGYSLLMQECTPDLMMLQCLRLVYEGYACIHYEFHDVFIKGVLYTKILRKNKNILQNMSSDNVRALFVHTELLRIIHFSQCNEPDRLKISSEMMEKMYYDFVEDASPANIDSLCALEGYIKKYEFKENEESIIEFYEPIDYDLEKLDIFPSDSH